MSGARLWKNSQDAAVVPAEVGFAIGIFAPQGENLVYSLGHEIWAIHAPDGRVADMRHEDGLIGPSPRHTTFPDGPFYYVTLNGEIVAYDVARKQVTRSPRPDMQTPQTIVRDSVLYSFDDSAAYAFDVKAGEKWRVRGKFLGFLDNNDTGLWALREDNVILRLDRTTGKILSQHSILWRPVGFDIRGNRFYAFTADGFAWSLDLT